MKFSCTVAVLFVAALFVLDGRAATSTSPPPCAAVSYDVPLPGAPMGAVPASDGRTIFVAVNATNPRQKTGIAILRCVAGRYSVARVYGIESEPTMISLTHDGSTLVVPDDNYIAFLDVKRMTSGRPGALIGYVEDIPGDDGGAVYAALSPDDRYAFVAEEQSGKLSVIDMQRVRSGAVTHDAIVREYLVGNAPVAIVFSKDGRYIFVTVQQALKRTQWDLACEPESGSAADPREREGAVVVLDASKIASATDPPIVSYVRAGCHPVRASLSPDGATLWVSARKSNAVLAFDTKALIETPANALTAKVAVGTAPVPLIVSGSGKHVLVGNSNRFNKGARAATPVDVIDTATHTVVGHLRAGTFPRQFAIARDGSAIFLTNYGSATLTVIPAAGL